MQLIQLPEDYKVLVLDVFDTLVCRVLKGEKVTYHKVFNLIDSLIGQDPEMEGSYSKVRIKVGRQVRKDNPYYSMQDLVKELRGGYTYLPYFESMIDSTILRATALGMELVPYIQMHEELDIVIASDTYYSEVFIRGLLAKHYGTTFDCARYLVSSSCDMAKVNGTMYKYIMASYGIKPNEALLITDSQYDIIPAEALGMQVRQIDTTWA